MTAASIGGPHRRAPPREYDGVPPCPQLPPLYPHCMRHQDHRCLYNAQQQAYRRQQPTYPAYHPYADGHAFPPPERQPPPTRKQQQSGHLVLKVVSEASAEPDKKANFEIVRVNVRHGRFRKAVPQMPLFLSILFCIVNMLAPGVGTFLAGLTVICGCQTEYEDKCTALLYNVLASFLQLLTALIVVGWVWSIMWGITFVSVSITKAEEDIVATL